MLFWYLMVSLSSLFENFAGVPFTDQWTIRVSRAPRLRISEDAPIVVDCLAGSFRRHRSDLSAGYRFPPSEHTLSPTAQTGLLSSRFNPANVTIERRPVAGAQTTDSRSPGAFAERRPHVVAQTPSAFSPGTLVDEPTPLNNPLNTPLSYVDSRKVDEADSYFNLAPETHPHPGTTLLCNLKKGYNTVGCAVYEDGQPWAASRVPFYVIVSVEGISKVRALLRVVSKALSVGVFAAGTAFFASATLITISVALTSLCTILGAGVFGRVVAMWMANEMIQEEPVLHKVVKTEREAGEHIREVLAQPGLLFEVMGHVVLNGRCIAPL